MRRVVVTGAGGLIGGALFRRLARASDLAVSGWSRTPRRGVDLVAFDLNDRAALARRLASEEPDIVVHAAGRTAGEPEDLLRDNTLASIGLLDAALERVPAAQIILLGTAGEYGDRPDFTPLRESEPCRPVGAYGLSKLAATLAANRPEHRARVTTLRVFNILSDEIGEAQVTGAFLARAAEALATGASPRVRMRRLGAVRDFVTLDDVVCAVERVIERRVTGEVVNVCSGKPTRVRDLLGALNAMIGDSIVIDEESADESAPASWSVGDPTKCRALLGFAPSGDLAATMRRLVDVTLPARVADLRQCGRPIAPASGKLFAESKADD